MIKKNVVIGLVLTILLFFSLIVICLLAKTVKDHFNMMHLQRDILKCLMSDFDNINNGDIGIEKYLKQLDIISRSVIEKYFFEIKKDNNKLYFKMIKKSNKKEIFYEYYYIE